MAYPYPDYISTKDGYLITNPIIFKNQKENPILPFTSEDFSKRMEIEKNLTQEGIKNILTRSIPSFLIHTPQLLILLSTDLINFTRNHNMFTAFMPLNDVYMKYLIFSRLIISKLFSIDSTMETSELQLIIKILEKEKSETNLKMMEPFRENLQKNQNLRLVFLFFDKFLTAYSKAKQGTTSPSVVNEEENVMDEDCQFPDYFKNPDLQGWGMFIEYLKRETNLAEKIISITENEVFLEMVKYYYKICITAEETFIIRLLSITKLFPKEIQKNLVHLSNPNVLIDNTSLYYQASYSFYEKEICSVTQDVSEWRCRYLNSLNKEEDNQTYQPLPKKDFACMKHGIPIFPVLESFHFFCKFYDVYNAGTSTEKSLN